MLAVFLNRGASAVLQGLSTKPLSLYSLDKHSRGGVEMIVPSLPPSWLCLPSLQNLLLSLLEKKLCE